MPPKTSPLAKAADIDKGTRAQKVQKVQVRESTVHGRGVFAARDLGEGKKIIEYQGEIIDWDEAQRRHPHDPNQPNHTFYFHLDDSTVIDGRVNGNDARWINHSCAPNCEAEQRGNRVFIRALRDIDAGEELFYDYGLMLDEPYTKALKKEFACFCGSKDCRKTMLAPKATPAKVKKPKSTRLSAKKKRSKAPL
jgi:SET domain-containing protein